MSRCETGGRDEHDWVDWKSYYELKRTLGSTTRSVEDFELFARSKQEFGLKANSLITRFLSRVTKT